MVLDSQPVVGIAEPIKKRTRGKQQKHVRGNGQHLRRLSALEREGPFGRTYLEQAIADGHLKSFKYGAGRFVYQSDWIAFLDSLGR